MDRHPCCDRLDFHGPGGGILANSPKVMNQPVIRVRVYNYAHIDRLALHDAKGQAAGIFAKAGVRVAWTVVSQKLGRGRTKADNSDGDFPLRILPAFMAARCNYKTQALGESVVSPGPQGALPGGTANVFYDHVKEVSTLWDMFPGEILGDAMAHELGHLLLGPGHSREGIMKARWTSRDLELGKLGKLGFSTEQLKALQRVAQLLPGNSLKSLVARR
jgi:hypothetical protein